jgi:hypothetical protein
MKKMEKITTMRVYLKGIEAFFSAYFALKLHCKFIFLEKN